MIEAASSAARPSEADIRAFVYAWYRLLDQHAPVEAYYPLLSGDTVELVLPEVTLRGTEAFAAWYRGGSQKYNLPGVINVFFDEVHELKRVDVSLDGGERKAGDYASALVVVKWEAHRWAPPKARSDILRFDAWQRWILTLSPQGRPVIRQYIVDKLEPLQGSAEL